MLKIKKSCFSNLSAFLCKLPLQDLERVELLCDSPNILFNSLQVSLAASHKDLKVLVPSLQNEFKHHIYANKNWETSSNNFNFISGKLGAKQSEIQCTYPLFFPWIILLGLINVHKKSYETVTLLFFCFHAIFLHFSGMVLGEHEEVLNVGIAPFLWLTTSQAGNFIFIWVLKSKYATFSMFIYILLYCIYLLLLAFLVTKLSGNFELEMNNYYHESLGLMANWSTRKESNIRINQNLVGFITSPMAWWIILCL